MTRTVTAGARQRTRTRRRAAIASTSGTGMTTGVVVARIRSGRRTRGIAAIVLRTAIRGIGRTGIEGGFWGVGFLGFLLGGGGGRGMI